MLPNNENYEKFLQQCQIDIKECEKEVSKKEGEIEALKIQRQGFIELREALTKILGVTNVEDTNYSTVIFPETPLTLQSKNLESFFIVETPKGSVEIYVNAFRDCVKIVDATIKFLRMVNQPQKTPDIVSALSKGGFESKSAFFSENVRSTLRSASKRHNGEIVWKDNKWQLAEWYVKAEKN